MKNQLPQKSIFTSKPVQASLALLVVTLFTLFTYSLVLAQAESVSQPIQDESLVLNADTLNLSAYRPYLVEIIDGSSVTTTNTAFDDPKSILDDAGFIIYPEDRYAIEGNGDLENKPLVGLRLSIDRATPVVFSLYGDISPIRTRNNTVSDLLKEKGVLLGAKDVVKPALDTKLTKNIKISVYKVGTQTIITDEVLPFTKTYIDDPTLSTGTQIVSTPGKDGAASVTYGITYYDGKEVSRQKIRSVTLKQPVNEIIRRGPVNTNGPLNAAQIQFLGNCEAGMNPTRNSGNGYYGAFQFSVDTWNAMGTGYARADLAPLNVQIRAVQQLLSRSSIFSQFPGCANQMVTVGLL